MWPPPRSTRRRPSSCPQRGGRFILGRSSKRAVKTVDMTILVLHVGILQNGRDGRSSLRFSTCFTIRAPTTMRAGLLPAPLCRFFSRLLYSCSILSQEDCQQTSPNGWTCSNTLEAQTARDRGIGSSISCRFLLILTPKGNHFQ